MQVVRVPFQQEVSTSGYEVAEIELKADLPFNAVMPVERRHYRSAVRFIAVEDEILNIITAYTGLNFSQKEEMLAFASLYGLPCPDEANRLPKIDRAGKEWVSYPVEAVSWFDWSSERDVIKEALEDRLPPAPLLDAHCYFAAGDSQGLPVLKMHAKNLVGAMAAYIADKLSEGGQFKECEECGAWFLMADARAQRAKYCRPACKMRAHRLR